MLPELESFSFGDSPELADELLELVLVGKKTATCWAATEGEASQLASAGSSRTGKGGRAILETVGLRRRRFGDVDAAFAHDECEGDRSLADWRRMHTTYFTRRGEFSPDMELYCERFTLIEVLKGE